MFVCLGNACRSPMAESIARRIAADLMEPSSAGLSPLGRVEALTKQTLMINGYSADGLESKPVLHSALAEADIVVNLSGRPKDLAFEDPANVEDWIVEDPYGADAEVYQRIFEDIERRVAKLADRLRHTRGSGTAHRNIKRKSTHKPSR
jgi:protein-tyrosine-phosphatase